MYGLYRSSRFSPENSSWRFPHGNFGGMFFYQSIACWKRPSVGMEFASENVARRPADHQETVRHIFLISWSHETTFLIPWRLEQRPQSNIPKTRLITPRRNLWHRHQIATHVNIPWLDILVRLTRLQERAWLTHLPQSSFLLSKSPPDSPRATYSYSEVYHHELFRYPGHHLRCHRWHCLR